MLLPRAAVVLVGTANPENLGGVARLVANFATAGLRLAAPRASVDDPRALVVGRMARQVLAGARVAGTLDEAVADAACVVGFSARRGAARPAVALTALGGELAARAPSGTVALVFGPEDAGLAAADVDRCDLLATIDLPGELTSLNLTQAVAIALWELGRATDPAPATASATTVTAVATREELEALVAQAATLLGGTSGWLGDDAEGERHRVFLRRLLAARAPVAVGRARLARSGLALRTPRALGRSCLQPMAMEESPHPRPGNGHDEPRRDEHDEPRRDEHDEHVPDDPDKKPERPQQPLRIRAAAWRREHPRGFVLLVAGLVVALAAAVLLWWHFHTHESTDDAQIDGHIAPVSARVAGTVVAVHVEDNTEVQRGQPLAELDPRDYQVALARAEAALAQARAELAAENPNMPITATSNVTQIATTSDDVDNAKAGIAAAEREQQSTLARVRSAEAANTRAEADLARQKYLLAQRAITQERFDQIAATAKAARADLDSARALTRAAAKTVEQQQLKLQQAQSRAGEAARNAPRQISIREANIEAKEAAVKAAEAAVERAKLDLAYTKIVAPVHGVVGKRNVEPGQHVQVGEELLAVVALDDLWVTANFKETQMRRMQPGQTVRIKVDALGETVDGTVESFAGATGARYSLLPPENATGNYVKVVQRLPVRIRIKPDQDPHHRLRPGMSVEPTVTLR